MTNTNGTVKAKLSYNANGYIAYYEENPVHPPMSLASLQTLSFQDGESVNSVRFR